MDTQAWADQYAAQIAATVRKYGLFIQYVAGAGECDCPDCQELDDDVPGFAYTVGLFGLGHPELLMVGVDSHTAAHVLNEMGARIREGENLVAGQMVSFDCWSHRVILEEVPNPGELVLIANDYYRRPDIASVPVLQLTYDDDSGRFPWDDGYATPALQPRPGTFRA